MPPAIVYTDMVNPADSNAGVFAGVNFFIVQRVPQRSHYVSLVETNGGRVVKLEAQADYLIADHMRHDAPAGALSYKFIEEAIKQGEIPDDESLLASRRKAANSATTTAVATSSKKSTRTPFTDDDDKLLYKLVHKANEQGLAIQGNTLYKALAAHNSRHTFQSWRDRYIKVLSIKPPTGWEAYPDARLPPLDTHAVELPSTALPRSTARSAIASTPGSRPKVPFTEEDDQELVAWVTRKAQQGARISGNAIYQELEARNPRHTYHSWRDRWVGHLSRRELDDDDDHTPLEAEDAGPEVETAPARPPPSPKPSTSKTPLKRPGFRIPPGASASAQASGSVIPKAAAPPVATSSTAKAPQSSSKHAARVHALEEVTEDTAHVPTASGSSTGRSTATRPVVTSKNQANTPMVRSRNMSSPILSQQTPAQPQQRALPVQPPPSSRQETVQTNPQSQSHDDSAFTDQDFDDLLSVALDIQNVCVGRYQESWIKWAGFDNAHTAVEWRSFYERRVLPVVLQREDGPERPESQKDAKWVEFWKNQGQPIEILPYKITSELQATSPDVANIEKVSAPQDPANELAEQDEEMADVAEQLAEVNENALLGPAKRKLQKIESTAEESAPKRQRTAAPPSEPNKSLAPVQRIPDETVGISGREARSPSHHSDGEEEASEDQAAGQLRREMAEDKDDRHQLTRANLARIQAENRMPEEQRGLDIEEDDEDDDQADFATYLASMLPQDMKEKALEAIETHDHQDDQENDGFDEDEDEDILTNNGHQELEPEYDPALLEIDPELDNPSYQSSLEYSTNNTAIHLDVPATQAWEASSAPSPSQSQRQRISTQAIFAAETQPFDLDVPLPPGEYLDEEAAGNYTTANTDSQILAEDEFWPWIDDQIKAGGYSEETVVEALRQTSFNPKLAALVLQAQGEKVDVAGVWTEEDDQVAEGSNAKAIRRLEGKHGRGSVEKRIAFLAEWRRDQEIAMAGEVAE
ncbi:hypothetical protein M436DRAFT_62670 [Aureobasidium namibiae CBS 147.97]|uniref:DNA-binding protein RAP1 n=1 Tax=Aureobasidium namibiae CBS 147.97 TaxID=1043004 RepID=A0A074WWY2_9PEZI